MSFSNLNTLIKVTPYLVLFLLNCNFKVFIKLWFNVNVRKGFLEQKYYISGSFSLLWASVSQVFALGYWAVINYWYIFGHTYCLAKLSPNHNYRTIRPEISYFKILANLCLIKSWCIQKNVMQLTTKGCFLCSNNHNIALTNGKNTWMEI